MVVLIGLWQSPRHQDSSGTKSKCAKLNPQDTLCNCRATSQWSCACYTNSRTGAVLLMEMPVNTGTPALSHRCHGTIRCRLGTWPAVSSQTTGPETVTDGPKGIWGRSHLFIVKRHSYTKSEQIPFFCCFSTARAEKGEDNQLPHRRKLTMPGCLKGTLLKTATQVKEDVA